MHLFVFNFGTMAFTLSRPDFVMDHIQPSFEKVAPSAFVAALANATEGDELRLIVSAPDFDTGYIKNPHWCCQLVQVLLTNS